MTLVILRNRLLTKAGTRPIMAAKSRLRLKCDGTRAETRFRLSAKRTSPFKSAGASVQSTTGSRGVRISRSYAGYTMFRGSVKGTGYPLHSPVSPSLPLPCVTVCHHVSNGLYHFETNWTIPQSVGNVPSFLSTAVEYNIQYQGYIRGSRGQSYRKTLL